MPLSQQEGIDPFPLNAILGTTFQHKTLCCILLRQTLQQNLKHQIILNGPLTLLPLQNICSQ